MANQYFVFKPLPEVGSEFSVEHKAAVHHIFTVMRAQVGQEIRLVFEEGKIGLAEVLSPNQQTFRLVEIITEISELPVQVTVGVGFPKGDKLDFITEKSTELGAAAIWAAPFKSSVAKWDNKKLIKKQEKLEKIALGAAEQSRRQIIPQVQLFEQFNLLTEKFSEFDQILIAYEESAKSGEVSQFKKSLTELSVQQKVLIVFGPEGGITPEEMSLFEQLGAKAIGLGPRILRAETAPLHALASISAHFELF
ncbi:16S rRNA (uracil(1498)-N(3))-methyltransferase [Lactococcus kimchii]|uniref:16S rRNA (uracil(1498)-N(3))-methyltransferase n=1 Tax=Lactococcus sp. S-13 TaxID=2507158 RepID=UPI00102356DF|nr:16S rRNA (uracil(1498)-N(3))-methyltransferase [Lactococcus sp. S-13]RZI49503.1 16S rRNA (uracil(1498)-N(3))-methyltransferase [Lactococcus sp. S-13]